MYLCGLVVARGVSSLLGGSKFGKRTRYRAAHLHGRCRGGLLDSQRMDLMIVSDLELLRQLFSKQLPK